MKGWPGTKLTLLGRIRNRNDSEAWKNFLDLYGPLVYGFIYKRVPHDADTSDIMQEVLLALTKGSYDRTKGPFHKWLLTVVLNKIRDYLDCRKRRPPVETSANIEEHPAKLEEEWDRDRKQALFDRAAELVRSETNPTLWEAFWLTTVEEKTGKEAAEILGLSVANVYSAKSRIQAKIRERVERLLEE